MDALLRLADPGLRLIGVADAANRAQSVPRHHRRFRLRRHLMDYMYRIIQKICRELESSFLSDFLKIMNISYTASSICQKWDCNIMRKASRAEFCYRKDWICAAISITAARQAPSFEQIPAHYYFRRTP